MNNPFLKQWGIQRRINLIDAIEDHYGVDKFKGKTILELGCGSGAIGMHFAELGATVTFSDARQEHLDIVRENILDRDKHKYIVADLEREFPFDEVYDYIFHIGVLYHLSSPWFSIFMAERFSHNLVLETEIIDSLNPKEYMIQNETGYSNSINGKAMYPSLGMLEDWLRYLYGIYDYTRFDSGDLNVPGWYHYNEIVGSTGKLILKGYRHRKLWFCRRKR